MIPDGNSDVHWDKNNNTKGRHVGKPKNTGWIKSCGPENVHIHVGGKELKYSKILSCLGRE